MAWTVSVSPSGYRPRESEGGMSTIPHYVCQEVCAGFVFHALTSKGWRVDCDDSVLPTQSDGKYDSVHLYVYPSERKCILHGAIYYLPFIFDLPQDHHQAMKWNKETGVGGAIFRSDVILREVKFPTQLVSSDADLMADTILASKVYRYRLVSPTPSKAVILFQNDDVEKCIVASSGSFMENRRYGRLLPHEVVPFIYGPQVIGGQINLIPKQEAPIEHWQHWASLTNTPCWLVMWGKPPIPFTEQSRSVTE